jgi:cyanophycinase-like exopeptidase
MTRLLTIMGSGETAPTMVKVHRSLVARAGGPAVLLDTPYGFQENADDISARAQQYFADSVGTAIGVASLRTTGAGPVVEATAVARVREAGYVFAGPGSPTYALRVWSGTPVPALLVDKLRGGGAVTFASAAALTLGLATVPVYEIYKAGEEPRWFDGLDLLGAATGMRAAVIPHFDNAEGGHHDTRFCYLGERRLAFLERSLPDDAFVLGVDEHTGVVLDLDARTATVVGIGTLTVRRHGAATAFPTGTVVGFDDLRAAAEGATPVAPAPVAAATVVEPPTRSLLDEADRLETAFTEALARRDVPSAVGAVLELDDVLHAWSVDTLQSDEPDRARATLRSMVVRLGEVAATGTADPRDAVAPFVDALLEMRVAARAAKDFATSDKVRDTLAAAGVEVRDTPDGTTWSLR